MDSQADAYMDSQADAYIDLQADAYIDLSLHVRVLPSDLKPAE